MLASDPGSVVDFEEILGVDLRAGPKLGGGTELCS